MKKVLTDAGKEFKLLPLTNDAALKIYFETEENRAELCDFLKTHLDVTDDDLEEIIVLNPILPRKAVSEKAFTVDLLLLAKNRDYIHVEMQGSLHPGFKERVQRYNARQAGHQQKRGEGYGVMKRSISLIILNESLYKDSDDYHEQILMRRPNGKVFTTVQEINIIDLNKLPKENEEKKHNWRKLFKVRTREELEMLVNESEEMKAAAEKLEKLSQDDHAWAYAVSYDHAMLKLQMIEEEHARKEKENAKKEQENVKKEQENVKKEQENVKKEQENVKKEQENVKKEQENVKKEQENTRKEQELAHMMIQAEKKVNAEKIAVVKRLLKMGLPNSDIAEGAGVDVAFVLEIDKNE